MKHISFEEYGAAKAEIIGGVEYKEKSTLEGDVIRKTYATEKPFWRLRLCRPRN